MKLQLKIQLRHIAKPPVWRKVSVPISLTFEELHLVIQAAFGWGNYHLYQFSPSGWGSYPIIEGAYEESEGLDAAETQLSEFLTTEGQKFNYIYDFGDSWEHSIVVEKVLSDSDNKIAVLAGKGNCPPEDCGGPWGYENLKIILSDRKHPEHKEMKEWLGMGAREVWDATEFDLEEAQAMIENIFS